MRITLLLVTFAVTVHADDLDKKLERSDAGYARAFGKLADRAFNAEQRATARMLYERALALDEDNRRARRALLFKRKRGVWAREREDAGEVGRWRDTDLGQLRRFRAERRKLESERATEWVRLCRQSPERLAPVLRFDPRNAALHAALGHKSVDGKRVRPEMESFAKTMPQRVAAWRECGAATIADPSDETVVIAGLRGAQPVFKVGDRQVASGFPTESTARFANKTECVQKMLRLTLGEARAPWDKGPVYFLARKQYRDFLAALQMPEGERARWNQRRHYWGASVQAFGARDLSEALDFYAHAAAVYSIGKISDPFPEGDPSRDAHPWLMEGYGLFVTLELFDTAETFLTSGRESTGKIESPLPPPEPIRRATALAHIQDELYVGSLPSLRELLGSSMNGLDKVRSVQAWTFVRFLLLLDPAAFRELPDAMRADPGKSRADRSVGALERVYGMDVAELERRWAIYLLEIA